MSEVNVSKALLYLEKVVEEHHLLVERLENLLLLDEPDDEETVRVLKELRDKRRELYESFKTLADNLEYVTYRQTREEALGLLNYYYAVMLPDEIKALSEVPKKANLSHLEEDIEKDIAMIDRIKKLIIQFVY
jgi:hypothetical protein